jgi:hypothetical protein
MPQHTLSDVISWVNTISVVNLSRASCDPRPRSNQMMSAAQHLALINTIMEIGANYKMASTIKK